MQVSLSKLRTLEGVASMLLLNIFLIKNYIYLFTERAWGGEGRGRSRPLAEPGAHWRLDPSTGKSDT